MSPVLINLFSLSPSDLGFMTSVYLIAFGATQFPLGVLLDRYGARKTLAPMMFFSVAASLIFAGSQNMAHLILSRTLMGIGMSGCLMAAFKAYAEWLPTERLPIVYSMESLMGGLGGMVATKPIAIAFTMFSWRFCYIIFAALTLCISVLVWVMVPQKDEKTISSTSDSVFTLFYKMIGFFGDRRFWFVAPIVAVGDSVMFTYLYLWIGPWLRDVAMFDENVTGTFMMFVFAGAAAGYFLNGVIAEYFQKKHWLSWEQIYLYSGAMLSILLAIIAFDNGRTSAPLWGVVMFFTTMTMIAFPITRRLYDSTEVGRALALINFLIFLVSFVFQWFIGVVLEFFPIVNGHFSPEGYRLSLAVIASLNALATLNFYFRLKNQNKY